MGRHDNEDIRYSREHRLGDDGYRSRRRSRSRSLDRDGRKRDRSRSRDRDRDSDRKEKKRKRERSEERKAKKAEKKRLKEEDARKVAELSVYSATDNPFHDVNLEQQFRWHKKADKEKKQGLTAVDAQQKDARRKQEAKEELERLNHRRAEREAEARLREEDELKMQRLQETYQMSEWLAKEDDFRLEQERTRAAIRVKEKRAKAIDFLALNLKYVNPPKEEGDVEQEDAGLEIDLDEPYNILDNLSRAQVDELHGDIQRYLSLEQSEVNIDFWTNMMVICEDRIDRLKADERLGVESAAAVESDISALLSGKSHEQLVSLQRQVQDKLTSGEPVDTDYWESLLKHLLVWKAKSKLKAFHEVVVRNRLEQLRRRQRDEALQAQEQRKSPSNGSSSQAPTYSTNSEEQEIDIAKAKEDLKALLEQRRNVALPKASQSVAVVDESMDEKLPSFADLASEALYRAEAERELDEEEELFNTEENIRNPTSYVWEDKYRPRKPRYFNRVHTGFEWNKYNQTHYDVDNPPPKVVQGYKFNIFYPDLIDKSKAPSYRIVEEPGNDDTCLLHFTAGPPYEDIAFRIVRRDWEYSHKRGFKSTFDRGCLSLWFNFKRNFYRK